MSEYKYSVLGDECTQCHRTDVEYYAQKRTRKCMVCYSSNTKEYKNGEKVKDLQDRLFARSQLSRAW